MIPSESRGIRKSGLYIMYKIKKARLLLKFTYYSKLYWNINKKKINKRLKLHKRKF